MTVSADHAIALAESWLPAQSGSAFENLQALRGRAGSFVPTWLSAMATRGPLPAHLAEELRYAGERIAWLRTVRDDIVARVPGSYAIKGHGIADRYPSPLVRTMADLDIVVPDLAAAWQVVEFLTEEHRTYIYGIVSFPTEGCAVITLTAYPEQTFDAPLALDVYTFGFPGDAGCVPSRKTFGRASNPGPAEHLIMIAAEALEGDFGLKDIFDAAVLINGDDAVEEFGLAHRYARELRIIPELAKLISLADEHGLPVPAFAHIAPAESRTGRATRTALRLAGGLRWPVRTLLLALQRSEAYPTHFRAARRRAWRIADTLLHPFSPLRGHLLQFGMPVKVTAPYPGPLLTAPHGHFLMVNSARVNHRLLHPALEFEDVT